MPANRFEVREGGEGEQAFSLFGILWSKTSVLGWSAIGTPANLDLEVMAGEIAEFFEGPVDMIIDEHEMKPRWLGLMQQTTYLFRGLRFSNEADAVVFSMKLKTPEAYKLVAECDRMNQSIMTLPFLYTLLTGKRGISGARRG